MKLHPNHADVQEKAAVALRALAKNGELLKHLVHSPESHLLFFTQLPIKNELKNWDSSSELNG
jgi:hypothetical protein